MLFLIGTGSAVLQSTIYGIAAKFPPKYIGTCDSPKNVIIYFIYAKYFLLIIRTLTVVILYFLKNNRILTSHPISLRVKSYNYNVLFIVIVTIGCAASGVSTSVFRFLVNVGIPFDGKAVSGTPEFDTNLTNLLIYFSLNIGISKIMEKV